MIKIDITHRSHGDSFYVCKLCGVMIDMGYRIESSGSYICSPCAHGIHLDIEHEMKAVSYPLETLELGPGIEWNVPQEDSL